MCRELEEKHGSLRKWPGPWQRHKQGICPGDKSSSPEPVGRLQGIG